MDKNDIIVLVNNKLNGTDAFLVEVKLSLQRIAVRIDKPTGITIGECTQLSRYLAEQLEPTGMLEKCELEVGSPGMSEPLLVYQQYLRRINCKIRVTDLAGMQHTGTLTQANQNGFTIDVPQVTKEGKKRIETIQTNNFPYTAIKETKLIF
ncbi:MAG: hypothetical protein JNK61_01860 [Bacteroidia bacterium]|nr:hypothetical protein [Bacteroidia bacterium]